MSLITKIPPHSRFSPLEVSFRATYNATTPFKYDFSIPANRNVPIFTLVENRVYLIEQLDWDGNIEGVDYATAQGLNPKPQLYLSMLKQSNSPIYYRPWTLGSFKANKEHVVFFKSTQNDTLQATFRAQFDQPFPLVSVPTIEMTLALNIYEITDQQWIRNFDLPSSDKQGEFLRS